MTEKGQRFVQDKLVYVIGSQLTGRLLEHTVDQAVRSVKCNVSPWDASPLIVLPSLLSNKAATLATSSGFVSVCGFSAGKARVLKLVFTLPGIKPHTLIAVFSTSSASISIKDFNPAFDTP